MNQRFVDFDRLWREKQREREPIVIRAFGEEVTLPASLPAAVTLHIWRLMSEGKAQEDLSPGDAYIIAEAVYGRERLERWAAQGMDTEQLMDLLWFAMEQYQDVGDQGKRTRPKATARSSKK